LLLPLLVLVLSESEIVSIAGTGEASGYYHVEQRQGVWWFMTPDGKPFYSMGVNVVDMGASRESYDAASPQYAAFQYYPSAEAWAHATLRRLRSWNFNTLGGWSDTVPAKDGMPYTVVLHLAGQGRVPWSDIFSEDLSRVFDEVTKEKVAPLVNDKNLLGYFSDNELGWWDDTILEYYLKQPQANATRKVLMRLLRKHYGNDFARLLSDFETTDAKNFDELDRRAALTLRPGGRGMEVVDEFTFLVAERYYKLAHDAIRRYDKHHLILGDRYQNYVPRVVARAAIPFLDVISTNYSADWADGRISEFYLKSLYQATHKPILITEFYQSATENRSGNRNSSAHFPVEATQRERARSFRNNASALASLPFVVGAHWFQYSDEPTNGRADGENYNFGLVDINDRPYEELTAMARSLSTESLHQRARVSERSTGQILNVPAGIAKPERGLSYWNKTRSFVAKASSEPADWEFADAYVCWNPQYLFLAVYASDFLEPLLYSRGRIPESERMTLTIAFEDSSSSLLVHFGAKAGATIEGPSVWLHEWNDPTRQTVLLKLPAAMFGKKALRAGDSLSLNATLSSHSRAERMSWQKVLQLTN